MDSIRLARYVPALTLMAVIYALSAQPDLGTGLGVWDTVLRKGAHMVEFGLLFLLWVFALGRTRTTAAAVVAIAYAVSDELHQTTVETRVGSPVDVLIDATGVALAALALRVGLPHALARRVARARPRQPHA